MRRGELWERFDDVVALVIEKGEIESVNGEIYAMDDALLLFLTGHRDSGYEAGQVVRYRVALDYWSRVTTDREEG